MVTTLLNKENLKALFHFVSDYLELFEFPNLKLVHKLLHEIRIYFIVVPIKWVADLRKLPESEESSEFPKEVTEQKLCIYLSLTLRSKLVEEHLVMIGNQKVIFITTPFFDHELADSCLAIKVHLLIVIKFLKHNEELLELFLVFDFSVKTFDVGNHKRKLI